MAPEGNLSETEREALRAEIRREVKTEIKQETRRRRLRGFLGCLAFYLIIFGVPTAWLAVDVAKSGWYEVPALTNWLYQPTTPRREVRPLSGETADTVWGESQARIKFDAKTDLATIGFKETGLTTIMRDAAASRANILPVPVLSPQVSISSTDIELFFLTPRPSGRDVTVRVLFTPVAEDGKLAIRISRVTLGRYDVPRLLDGYVSKMLNDALTAQFESHLPTGFSFNKVVLEDGRLSLVVQVSQ